MISNIGHSTSGLQQPSNELARDSLIFPNANLHRTRQRCANDQFSKSLMQEAEQSAPLGLHCIKATSYKIKTGIGHHLRFGTVRVHNSSVQKDEINHWRENLQQSHGYAIVLEHVDIHNEFKQQLIKLADPLTGVISDPDKLRRASRLIHGVSEPTLSDINLEDVRFKNKSVDLTKAFCISIDPKGTRDIDDTFSILGPDAIGNYLVRVNFISAAHLVREKSQIDIFTKRAGQSIYCRDNCLPLLGSEISTDLASFIPEHTRLGYTVEMKISSGGQIISANVFPSRSVNHSAISIEEANIRIKSKEYSGRDGQQLKLLSEVTSLMQKRREQINKTNSALFEVEKTSYSGVEMMVAELMISSREALTQFFKNNQIPCIYKTHRIPDRATRKEIANELKQKGLQYRIHSSLSRSDGLRKIIDRLYEDNELRTINRLIGLYRGVSQYSAQYSRHHALQLPAYMEIKARHHVGIVNQRQLKSFFAAETPKSRENLIQIANGANAVKDQYWKKVVLFNSYNELAESLELTTQPFAAHIKSTKTMAVALPVSISPLCRPIMITNCNSECLDQIRKIKTTGYNIFTDCIEAETI